MNLKGFIKECHKKEVFKMLSIYIVSSWVILQVLSVIAEPLGLPQKSVTYLIIILLIGFPISIYYIWKFKLLKYEIQQTEDPNTPYNKSAFQKMYFSTLFLVALVSGGSIALIINNNFGANSLLEEIQNNNKIAVLNFKNTTGDKKLDNVGDIAAQYISHGITEKEVGQVISPKLVNDYTSIIKSKAGASIDINNILTTYFKPGKVIDGAFYKEKDSLLLQGSIKNGFDETLISFETIKCDINSPLDCAKQLKQEILGYLRTEGKKNEQGYIENDDNEQVAYYEETPPNYIAFEYLTNALNNLNNSEKHLELLNKAIETDPNFFEPKIHRVAHYYNQENYKIADSLRHLIDLKSNLSNRQKNILLFYESMMKGRNDRAYRTQKEEYKLAYKDQSTNMTTMTIALQYVNRPEDIEDIYNEIPMKDLVLENCSRCGFRYYLKNLADVELGNYNKVIKTLTPITNIIEANYLKRPLISAFVKSDKLPELEKYLSDYALTASYNDITYLNIFTGIQFINTNKPEEANKYFNKVITSNIPETSKSDLSKAYYFKGDYANAQEYYIELNENEPEEIEYLVHLSICYFNNGEFEASKTLITKLDDLRAEYQFGAIDYGWAQYYNAIGDKDKALEFLLKAVVQGYNYLPTTFQNDPHFRTIKNSPEFKNRIMNYWKNKTL